MQTEEVPLKRLRPHPKNVRQGDIGAISESLRVHGQYRPIVAQTSTGHILAGNHTYKAAKALKWDTIHVVWVDVDDDEALRILLVDNRTTDLATYDSQLLADLLTAMTESEMKLAGTGFDGDDLDELLADLGNNKSENQNDPPPPRDVCPTCGKVIRDTDALPY